MKVQTFLTTPRLIVEPLTLNNVSFIFQLVNTEGWIRFIGDRNITSQEKAQTYIQKILESKNISYYVVKLKNNGDEIGIVTFIQRTYLEHPDIGFAFLPGYSKMGYAYEATDAVLKQLIQQRNLVHILATTLPENINSIKLLKKIGLVFEKEIEVEQEKLHVYGTSIDKLKTV